MKILLGSHGVGKSTLLKRLNSIRPEYYTTDGFSRPVKAFKIQTGISSLHEQILINELTVWGFNNYLAHPNVISTRSPIDAIVYSNLLFPEINTVEIEKGFISNLGFVEKVFYIPIEFEIENDGTRFIDLNFQKEIDTAMLAFCDKYRIQLKPLTGPIENRVRVMERYL